MSKPNTEEIYIETLRRVSNSRIDPLDLRTSNSINEGIKKIRSANTGHVPVDSDTIQVKSRLSNAEIGVIEATRRISGVNAALHELRVDTLPANRKKDPLDINVADLTITAQTDGTITVEDKKKEGNFGLGDKEWHLYSPDDLYKELKTDPHGLTSAEHAKRLAIYGENLITPPKTTHWLVKLAYTLVGGFQLMMWFGAVLCFVVFGITNGEDVQTLALGIVLIVVVLVTTTFQTIQEGKSDKVMAALKALAPSTVFVYRDGILQNVPAASLVPGDIVKVTGGEKVPADVRVLSSSDLKVNNASLTGENVDIKLGVEANHKDLYEAKNVARSGCNFTSGNALCAVFATGDNTFFGSIASSATAIVRPETLMKHEIHRLINIMAVVAFSLGISFFILALFNGYTWIEAIVFMIGIVVANVPEGLLPQMTVALTLTAQRMLKLGVLVSNLEIIETLGAVDIICSDKTGTLTCNRMTVSHVVYDMQITITPITPNMEGDAFPLFDKDDAHFQALQRIASLNSDAVFLPSSDEEPDVLKKETKGDASESAIIKFVEPLRPIKDYRVACQRLASIPFNSSNKWMLAIHEQEGPGKDELPVMLMVKGAPERVMNMCTTALAQGKRIEITPDVR
ncbi:MAG: hypothetical protein EOP84_15150, partial [Verrucomicrobiaceae bacterium]